MQKFPQPCLRLCPPALQGADRCSCLGLLAASPSKPGVCQPLFQLSAAAGKPPPDLVWVRGAALTPTGPAEVTLPRVAGASAGSPTGPGVCRVPLLLQVPSQGASRHSAASLAQAATRHGGWVLRGRVLRGQVPLCEHLSSLCLHQRRLRMSCWSQQVAWSSPEAIWEGALRGHEPQEVGFTGGHQCGCLPQSESGLDLHGVFQTASLEMNSAVYGLRAEQEKQNMGSQHGTYTSAPCGHLCCHRVNVTCGLCFYGRAWRRVS